MLISFKQKIPIYQHPIYNKKTNKFENATFFQTTCENPKDIDNFIKKAKKFFFAQYIYNNMLCDNCDIQNFKHTKNTQYYTLETNKQETVGICEIEKYKNSANIDYIETSQNYKYCGQTLIACIAKKLNKDKSTQISVNTPLGTALNFYINICGFKNNSKTHNITINNKNGSIKRLIKQVEKITDTPIVDCRNKY